MSKYKITLTLTNGIVHKIKLSVVETGLAKVIDLVQKSWRNGLNAEIQLGTHFYKVRDISHMRVKKVWF